MKAYKLTLVEEDRKERNESRGGEENCCMCGKPITKENAQGLHMLHMCPDGILVDDRHDPIEFEPTSEMGYFYVGDTCYKRFLKKAKEMSREEILEQCSI